MEDHARYVRESVEEELFNFEQERGYEYDGDDDPMDVTAELVGSIIIDRALDGFYESGPLAEAPGIPYCSPREILLYGLESCDPMGGSSSSMHFMASISEFLEFRWGM